MRMRLRLPLAFPRRTVAIAVAVVITGASLSAAAVATNAGGIGDRFENLVARVALIVDPPPDRPIDDEVLVTPRPSVVPTLTPIPTGTHEPGPSATLAPPPTPEPTPARVPVDRILDLDPDDVFASQLTKDWCAPAGTQMTLAALGLADNSDGFQRELAGRIDEWESRRDSLNGGWGPAAIDLALAAYGADGYEVRAYETREDALRDAARAIDATGAPVVLLAWRGAHTWVMTGYRADADPSVFSDAHIIGAYILDPWYPRVSSIWGPSDPPNTFQDEAEMRRNFLPWKRPEGRYPNRDGLYISVVPVSPGGRR
jgi:hypothetical protein